MATWKCITELKWGLEKASGSIKSWGPQFLVKSLEMSIVGSRNNLYKTEFWHIQGNGNAKAKSKES